VARTLLDPARTAPLQAAWLAEKVTGLRIFADDDGKMNRSLLDTGRPVGLLLCGILHHIADEERPAELTAALCRALPAGSYVFIHHLIDSGDPAIADVQAAFQAALGRGQFRTQAQVRDMFNGLELVEPGLVPVPEWRPDRSTPSACDFPVLRLALAGVARKP
jgi:hypothetical protein